jgi:adenylosuccinate lyase
MHVHDRRERPRERARRSTERVRRWELEHPAAVREAHPGGLIEADPGRMAQDLAGAWEVLGEAVQTVLRAAGVPDGYERLKEFTRGRAIDAATLGAFIDALPLPAGEKARLRALTPAQYTGLAAQLARGV